MSERPSVTADGANQAPWDESRLEDSIQRLNQIQVKTRILRDIIPKMLETLNQKHPSPEALYTAFVKAANDAQMGITEFTALMRDDDTKAILAQAIKSQQEDPSNIKPWRHKDHADWFDVNGRS